jgi:hypothetical protein
VDNPALQTFPAYYFGGMPQLRSCKAIPATGFAGMIRINLLLLPSKQLSQSARTGQRRSSQRWQVFHITSYAFDVGTSQNPSALVAMLGSNKI